MGKDQNSLGEKIAAVVEAALRVSEAAAAARPRVWEARQPAAAEPLAMRRHSIRKIYFLREMISGNWGRAPGERPVLTEYGASGWRVERALCPIAGARRIARKWPPMPGSYLRMMHSECTELSLVHSSQDS